MPQSTGQRARPDRQRRASLLDEVSLGTDQAIVLEVALGLREDDDTAHAAAAAARAAVAAAAVQPATRDQPRADRSAGSAS